MCYALGLMEYLNQGIVEELFKMTLLMRGRADYLTDRYSERNERQRKAIDAAIQRI